MPTKVFVSYAQVPESHRWRVAELAASLRGAGLDVVSDHDVTSPQGPPEGWPKWMLDQIEQADWVLVVCNEAYYRRFRGHEAPGTGLGASWEGAVIGQALYSDGTRNRKFIPILLGDEPAAYVPEPLRGATYYRLPVEFSKLAAALLGGSPGEMPAGARLAWSSPSRRPIAPYLALPLLVVLGLVGWFLWKAELRRPPDANFLLTVYVGPPGPQDTFPIQGAVVLDLGTNRRSQPIDEKSQALFPEIPASFRGQEVNVALNAEGYELAAPGKYRLDQNTLYLRVRKKSGHLAGRVQDEEARSVPGARIEAAGLSTKTDDSGHFDLMIPADHLQPDLVFHVEATGYDPKSGRAVVGSNEIIVNLTRSH
ncbi:MAG TPA: TIR domain-containing protein [Thermoanaerobaculia bacterium]|nr:TIR domain-containing protein [Thermoanaerobaculia bacterium]